MSNLAARSVTDLGSYLSDGVYHIICGLENEFQRTGQTDSPFGETFNIDDFSVLRCCDGSIDFVNTVRKLLPVCHSLHGQLMLLTGEQFDAKYGIALEWTGCREIIVECFEMVKGGDPVDVMLSFLLIFSIMEHSLGDVYLSTSSSNQCPTNLKELLLTKQIQELLGYNVSMVLYVLAGPPQGANLRNVLWHGFASPMEVPPQYCSFLLFMLSSMYCKFSDVNIKRRTVISFANQELLSVFPTIECIDCGVIYNALANSMFISPRMLPVWEKVFYYYQQKRYSFVLILLMPQLEHSLRMLFVLVNQCPERVLTAESTALYTTFDEILAPSLPDGPENKLRSTFSDSCVEMLLDVLVHCAGPRLRDHISHGEVNLESVPKQLSSHVICICVALAVCFSETPSSLCCSNSSSFKETADKPVEPADTCITSCSFTGHTHIIEQIVQAAKKYCSVYHPIATLKREICFAGKHVEDLKRSVSFPEDVNIDKAVISLESKQVIQPTLNKLYHENGFSAHVPEKLLDVHTDGQFVEELTMLCKELKMSTLFRPKRELEIVSLLCSITDHCCATAIQIYHSAHQRHQQWIRKELRSRQRTNYKKLLTLLPFYQDVLKIMLVLVLGELASLHENSTSSPKYINHFRSFQLALVLSHGTPYFGDGSKSHRVS